MNTYKVTQKIDGKVKTKHVEAASLAEAQWRFPFAIEITLA